MLKALCWVTIVVMVESLIVKSRDEIRIDVALGTVYQQEIPIVFASFQHTVLKQFKKKSNNFSSRTPICEVRVAKEGELVQKAIVAYGFNGYQNRSEQYFMDKVIYRLKDLEYLKVFVDAILFKNKIVAFFNQNEVIIYDIDAKTGAIIQQNMFNISSQLKLGDGLFVIVAQSLLFISSNSALKMGHDGSYTILKGFNGTETEMTALSSIDNKIYIGLGEKGLARYIYHPQNESLSLQQTTTFALKTSTNQVQFDVDQFSIDNTTKKIFILDYSQGLLQFNLSQIQQNKTTKSSTRLLISSCRNLILLSTSIFVTCPEIVQIQLNTGRIAKIIHTNFYAYAMQFYQERLYLYGREEFAVYDLFGKAISEYALSVHSELSMLVRGYLLTFGSVQVVSEFIIPQKQQIFCYSNRVQDEGQYAGLMQTQGICKQYLKQSGTAAARPGDTCLVEYPILIVLNEKSKPNFEIQLIVFGVWLGLCVIIGLLLALNHIRTHRSYRTLTEQQSKQLQQVEKKEEKGSRQEEEVAAV